jgi:hypothetical protein
MDCKGFTEIIRTTLTTELTDNSTNTTTMITYTTEVSKERTMDSTIVLENSRPIIGIIVFIVLAVIIIVIISVVIFVIYWYSREKDSGKHFSTVMSSTKTTEKKLSSIGSETTEKSVKANEDQLSTINTEKS